MQIQRKGSQYLERAQARIQIPLKLNLQFFFKSYFISFPPPFFSVNILYVEKMETKIVFSAMKKIMLLQAH